jgi:hypothetical protein
MAISKIQDAGVSLTSAALPAGSVLQVVSFSYSTEVSTSSDSEQETGLVATITPTSSTSKILVTATPYIRVIGGQCYAYLRLWRNAIGSGELLIDGYPIIGSQSNTDLRGVGAMQYLDSPATTSATTYRVSMNAAYSDSIYINSTTNPSCITLMEIAA